MKSKLDELIRSLNFTKDFVKNYNSRFSSALDALQSNARFFRRSIEPFGTINLARIKGDLSPLRGLIEAARNEFQRFSNIANEFQKISIEPPFIKNLLKNEDFLRKYEDIFYSEPRFLKVLQSHVVQDVFKNIQTDDLKEFISRVTQKTEERIINYFKDQERPNKNSFEGWIQILLSIFSILLGYVLFSIQESTKKTELNEIKNEVKKEIIESVLIKRNEILKELEKIRPMLTNHGGYAVKKWLDVKASKDKKAKKIGSLKKGQVVYRIEDWNKWVKIRYFDLEKGVESEGWVLKKYLKEQ